MVQIINDPFSGNVAGRLGAGVGQGLSEHLPKEIERLRLSSGLKKLNQKNIKDPFEFLANVSSIPGITPQMIESFGQLARERLRGQALSQFGNQENQPRPFPSGLSGNQESISSGQNPSITTRPPIEATIEPFIPRQTNEKLAAAGEKYNANPGLYGNDPERAIAQEDKIDADEASRNAALQLQRKNQQDVQNIVTSELEKKHAELGGIVPSEVYRNLQNKAINAVRSVKNGGEGLTEQEATNKYSNELNQISKDYSQLHGLGKFANWTKSENEISKVLKGLQSNFSARGEEEMMAKDLMSKNGFSPDLAYSIAYPISKDSAMGKYLKDAPASVGFGPISSKERRKSPDQIFEEVASLMDKKSGPIPVTRALEAKGYDGNAFMNFLQANQDKYLTGEQAKQLTEARNYFPTLNDLYYRSLLQ